MHQIADISMTDCVLFMVDEPQAYFRLRAIIINTTVTEWNKGKRHWTYVETTERRERPL